MRNFIIPLLICTFGCTDGGSTDPNTGDGGNATTDGGNTSTDGGSTDDGADTGEEVTKNNCGGPEPNKNTDWWVCENGSNVYEGETWPAAGGPEDLEQCLTSEGWGYELSEDGNSVTLTRSDGWVLTCELDD